MKTKTLLCTTLIEDLAGNMWNGGSTYPNHGYNYVNNNSFNLAGVNVALIKASIAINVMSGDYFRIGYSSGGGDPFAGGIIDGVTGVATYPILIPVTGDISDCIGANCSIGFQLQSNSSLTDLGVAITGFSIGTLTLNATSYNTVTLTEDPGPARMEELRTQNAHVKAVQPNFVYRLEGSGNAQ
jgi:hypothetical protein